MKNMLSMLLLLLSHQAICQKTVPVFGQINWISGFAKEISGENIAYFSAFPDYATTALLTRCTDGNRNVGTIEGSTSNIDGGKLRT